MAQSERFGSGTFTNLLWVANKRVFAGLNSADVEMETKGTFEWVFADSSGNFVRSLNAEGGGWTSVHLPSLGLYNFNGSIGFRNPGSGTKVIRDVVVYFE